MKLKEDLSLDIKLLLNCNKIKKLDASVEEIKEAVKKSSLLILSENEEGIKRIVGQLP